jgi:sec-independent protein translocase protein TatB
LVGSAQRYVNDVKRDIDREVQIDELRTLQTQMQDAARDIETSVSASVADVKTDLDRAQESLEEAARQADLNKTADAGNATGANPTAVEPVNVPSATDLTALSGPEHGPHSEPHSSNKSLS